MGLGMVHGAPIGPHRIPIAHSPSIQLDYLKYFSRSAAIGLF
jgi:hypothetical protein